MPPAAPVTSAVRPPRSTVTECGRGAGAGGAVMVSTLSRPPSPTHVVSAHTSESGAGLEPCGAVRLRLLDAEQRELAELRQCVHGEPAHFERLLVVDAGLASGGPA